MWLAQFLLLGNPANLGNVASCMQFAIASQSLNAMQGRLQAQPACSYIWHGDHAL